MKIGLIQVDGKLPNLALLKLSTWHKQKGDEVYYIDISTHQFDRIYASKIFVGGSGYDLKSELPKEIELLCPDYDQFKMNYSFGFTSRGCFRSCEFCIVREKEGFITEWQHPEQFVKHDKVILLDNNFLASPKWKEKLQWFIDNKIKVSFNQGLDIRLINNENAQLLNKVKYYDYKFKKRRLYFAFDDPNLESTIIEKVNLLKNYGIKPEHLLFYVLIGFNTTIEQNLRRCKVLVDLGCFPFIMLYNNQGTQEERNLARYINKRYFKVLPWEKYDQHYRRKKNNDS